MLTGHGAGLIRVGEVRFKWAVNLTCRLIGLRETSLVSVKSYGVAKWLPHSFFLRREVLRYWDMGKAKKRQF